jgi:hypothetical protein
MVDKTRIIETVIERLKKLSTGNYLDLRTYKRNRYIIIIKKSEEDLLVIEDGYCKERFYIKSDKLKKLLTALLRKEFPRSHKIRLYSMGRFIGEEVEKIKRKIL